jgi:hypothetical protein
VNPEDFATTYHYEYFNDTIYGETKEARTFKVQGKTETFIVLDDIPVSPPRPFNWQDVYDAAAAARAKYGYLPQWLLLPSTVTDEVFSMAEDLFPEQNVISNPHQGVPTFTDAHIEYGKVEKK